MPEHSSRLQQTDQQAVPAQDYFVSAQGASTATGISPEKITEMRALAEQDGALAQSPDVALHSLSTRLPEQQLEPSPLLPRLIRPKLDDGESWRVLMPNGKMLELTDEVRDQLEEKYGITDDMYPQDGYEGKTYLGFRYTPFFRTKPGDPDFATDAIRFYSDDELTKEAESRSLLDIHSEARDTTLGALVGGILGIPLWPVGSIVLATIGGVAANRISHWRAEQLREQAGVPVSEATQVAEVAD